MNSTGPSAAYPFVTKRQVLDRLDRDPAFVREAIEILHRRFVDRDVLPPPAGWMSSHRKLGEELHARLAAADCTAADVVCAAALAKRYAKQITRVLRDNQLARDPRLGLAAAVFGVRRADDVVDVLDDGADPYTDVEKHEDAEACSATPDAHEPPPSPAVAAPSNLGELLTRRRRPGRPKGSKNKPKAVPASSKPTKRRRP